MGHCFSRLLHSDDDDEHRMGNVVIDEYGRDRNSSVGYMHQDFTVVEQQQPEQLSKHRHFDHRFNDKIQQKGSSLGRQGANGVDSNDKINRVDSSPFFNFDGTNHSPVLHILHHHHGANQYRNSNTPRQDSRISSDSGKYTIGEF